ncbi:hypothetical protein PVAND_011367 [Polypedilum vanderplanki]|uniref:Rab GTPase-activating protein 1-like protein n=1 Tax=Polypedilum vanderplanki TaxID=319348 RepID=A0A9J6CJ83_POLVA|nr:hypothetical protein PVAND_011367 [Polypedilum vanderplanki]
MDESVKSDEERRDNVDEKEETANRTISSSSSNSDYELVDNDNTAEKEYCSKKQTPVLENFVSEDLICDAMINSPSSNNILVGKSIFYDCLGEEKSEEKGHTDTDEDATYEIDPDYKNDGNFTIFSNVNYLGSANLQLPKSESEILRNINELNTVTNGVDGVKIKISIPNCSDGSVILYQEETDEVYSSFDIQSILFYARGKKESSDQACFAFSWSHGDSKETAIYQCHVFRCNIPEAVNHVSNCFAKAFTRIPQSMACSMISENFAMSSITSDISGNPLSSALYEFIVSLEIRERVSKNTYTNVSREKSCFKIRQNCDKEIYIIVKQLSSNQLPPLFIERCFGVLLSIGKIKKQADMLLLELLAPGTYMNNSPDFQIVAKWDLNDKAFEIINESQKTHLITIAIDLVIKGVQEPVRFVVETFMKIDNSEAQSSRFSNSFLFHQGNKRPFLKKFYIQLKENKDTSSWVLDAVDPSDEILEPTPSSSFNQKIKNFSKIVRSTSSISFEDLSVDDITDDEDEPLASGTGEVSKDCPQVKLDLWDPVLSEWNSTKKRPKNLSNLIRFGGGIPEALRCQLWQKLSKTDENSELRDEYRILITKESKCEDVILRDVHRTFPAHVEFREKKGTGQESLYKVSRAYSVYDTEIGYCQGLSFIAATLLLHMPEEESFTVLVSIMYDYGLRELYKQNFENLSLSLFQLTCMLRDQLPDLYEHFLSEKVELHMFASQWFLTLFTARFPLPFVFQCIDLFLLDGKITLFQVAFALLSVCRKELLSKDFESILKYIRVQLPKKFRSEAQVSKLIKIASECKIKKLKKYEEEYNTHKEDNEKLEKMLAQYQLKYLEDRKLMKAEITQLQQRIRKLENDEKNSERIISDYKNIITRQEQQLEILRNATTTTHDKILPTTDQDCNDTTSLKQRIKELEVELAMAKVAQVESECQNQHLKHQLMNMTNNKNSSQNSNSWRQKFDAVVNSVNIPAMNNIAANIPTFQSHISELTHLSNNSTTVTSTTIASKASMINEESK